jgi:hypothetical protein
MRKCRRYLENHCGDSASSVGLKAAMSTLMCAGPVMWRGNANMRGNSRLLPPMSSLVNGTVATQAVRDATRTIPVVFVNLSDPVATGVVSNLARPEANLTGFSAFEYSLGGRWLSLLKEMVPQLSRVAALFNPNTAPFASFYLRAIRDATDAAVVKFAPAGVSSATEIEVAMAALAGSDVGGMVVVPDVFNNANSATIIETAPVTACRPYTTIVFLSRMAA